MNISNIIYNKRIHYVRCNLKSNYMILLFYFGSLDEENKFSGITHLLEHYLIAFINKNSTTIFPISGETNFDYMLIRFRITDSFHLCHFNSLLENIINSPLDEHIFFDEKKKILKEIQEANPITLKLIKTFSDNKIQTLPAGTVQGIENINKSIFKQFLKTLPTSKYSLILFNNQNNQDEQIDYPIYIKRNITKINNFLFSESKKIDVNLKEQKCLYICFPIDVMQMKNENSYFFIKFFLEDYFNSEYDLKVQIFEKIINYRTRIICFRVSKEMLGKFMLIKNHIQYSKHDFAKYKNFFFQNYLKENYQLSFKDYIDISIQYLMYGEFNFIFSKKIEEYLSKISYSDIFLDLLSIFQKPYILIENDGRH